MQVLGTACDQKKLHCTEADSIAATCAVCYGLLIPSFLAYLMFKQHLALAPSRRFVSHVAQKQGGDTVWVWPVAESEKTEPEQDKAGVPSHGVV